MKKLFLTIDVEEWYRAENIRQYVTDEKKTHSSSNALDKVVDILEETQSRATLFIVSSDIPRYQSQLMRALSIGCEFASHTHDHKLLTTLCYNETLNQLKMSKDIIEQKFSKEVLGFRSPCFSQNDYLDEVLSLVGYKYTSNKIIATFHDRYGSNLNMVNATPDIGLPISKILGIKYPTTGGGWFRLFPLSQQIRALQKGTVHNVFYCHPWDFDPNQPLSPAIPLFNRYRHSLGNRNALNKLRKLIGLFDCSETLGDLYNAKYSGNS